MLQVPCGLAFLFQGFQVSKQTFQDGISNGEHHGCCSSVAKPHGQKGWGYHHPQYEPEGKRHSPQSQTLISITTAVFKLMSRKRLAIGIKGPRKFSHQAGFTPTIVRTFRAILRCSPHSSIDDAMTRPLRKRKLVSRKYWGQTVLDGRIPRVGKRQTGSMAVTARGRASVHQNTAISSTT